jgi:hypothetical protein
MYCTVMYCTVMYCTVMYCTVMYCTVMYCTVMYCTVMYCTVMYCTVMYCIHLEVYMLLCIGLTYIVPSSLLQALAFMANLTEARGVWGPSLVSVCFV